MSWDVEWSEWKVTMFRKRPGVSDLAERRVYHVIMVGYELGASSILVLPFAVEYLNHVQSA
jgi:hypothetical protein